MSFLSIAATPSLAKLRLERWSRVTAFTRPTVNCNNSVVGRIVTGIRVASFSLAALLLLQSGVIASPRLSSTDPSRPASRLHALKLPPGVHLVERGVFETLTSDGSDLLAVEQYGSGVSVVRIDPRMGGVLVRSPVLPEATQVFVVKSNIWVEMDAAGSLVGRLVELDALTLRPVRAVRLDQLSDVSATSTGLLWLATGPSRCHLKRLSPEDGAVLARVSIPGSFCYLAIDASVGVLLSVSNGKLFSVDARSGRILHRSMLAAGGYWSSVAADGFFWFDSGGMSLPSTLSIYRTATLQLVRRELPPTGTCADITQPFFGCAGDALSYAAGLVWAANWNSLGCADPTAPALIGSSRPLGAIFPVVALGFETYGIDEAPYPSASVGIVRFVPPPNCRVLMRPDNS